MNESRSKFQTFLHSPLFLIALGVFLVTVVVAVILLLKPASKDSESTTPSIRVTNFSNTFPNLDNTVRTELEKSLYAQVINDAAPFESATAVIREGSLVSIDYNKYHTGDFLIDIESLGLSYLVSFSYGNFAGREVESVAFATFYCPKSDQLVYPAFACSANVGYSRPSTSDLEAVELSESSLTNQ